MRISDWSSDVCSSDLELAPLRVGDHRADLGTLAAGSFRDGVRERLQRQTGVTREDRKSVVQGKSVSVRVGLGGGRIIKQNNKATLQRAAMTHLNHPQ